ncbi:hypothetical protein RvY_17453 [Ramazzottius varieornatus]|uniref:Uncharacterized protein n=1 Tax=Ramazzottius varieornatus TaxID=947166 RepID=A0A1D1W615_RAMVA|nr:hypothetical protein RvY_17453 [Ramazzottius varieornatus]
MGSKVFPQTNKPLKGNTCIARDGRATLDANFKTGADCGDPSQLCGTEFKWQIQTNDSSVGRVDIINFIRGCLPACDGGSMACGKQEDNSTGLIPGSNMTSRSANFNYRALCKTDYCNAHPIGGVYMGLLDGDQFVAPSRAVQFLAAILPITLAVLAVLFST